MFLGSAPKHPFSLERFFRWRCYEDYSGGIATDLFVHLCTTIHFLMDAKVPARVMAMGELYRWKESRDVPDTLNAMLEYPEGFVVNLSSTFNNQTCGRGQLPVPGHRRRADARRRPDVLSRERASRTTAGSSKAGRALEDAYYKDPKVHRRRKWSPAKAAELDGSRSSSARKASDATVAHFGHFFESIRTRKPYWEDAAAGHHAAACAHMVNLSAAQQRMVEWDFAKDDIKA